MIKKLKRLWKLSQKDPAALSKLESLSDDQLLLVPDANDEPDEKAVFIGEGTHEEYEEFLKEEKGLKPWYERIKKL